ncbi:hypothetical protein M2451_003803 [Dysgonomonas sp. PFB1-18]|uniref:hypothetical protein n=1 Tax=unclassified Dysgonomonas TaxID=2630389 RepID=UPI002476AB3C|nr:MULTISPECIES: hypothetical protein [unclassified Dysgonomonas]MDH6310939.1 hypothetical protein [Dysgonomonas sp. PF1-14]MDH6340846.1 hypothetical protein [Dysgonomonas sp. PF1-16]MDH6382462.1 hypothetical protein [Dysgonomonas sp. PFB1-18]MDH6399811.1 hypothetical protein [Dysgonomonas sp. PF1-23]
MNKITFSAFLVIIILILFACNNDNCSKKLKYVKLNYYLFEHISLDGSSYCCLVNESLTSNENSILKLSKIEVSDGATYEHCAVLLEIIDKIRKINMLI